MNVSLWAIRSYRFAYGVLLSWLMFLALLGLYNAIFISHLPHIVFKRAAIIVFYLVLLAQALMGVRLFQRTWRIGLVICLLAVGVFIRYQAFPFHYVREDLREDFSVKDKIDQFKATNTIGNGSQIGEWDSDRPKWYMTMGDSEILPLLFSIGLPLSAMVAHLILRRNKRSVEISPDR